MKRSVDSRFVVAATLLVVAVSVPLIISGCEPGGGASAATTVRLKASDVGDAAVVIVDSKPGSAAEAAGGFGTFRGRIVLEGAPPALPLPPIVAQGMSNKDPEVCARDASIPNEKLLVGEGNGVQHVFVYLAKAPRGVDVPPPAEDSVEFDQKNCRFEPHTLLVRTGQTVKILSGDSAAHNTHTFPELQTGINTLIAADDRSGTTTTVYNKAEKVPVSVKCDFHAWMQAYHLPLDHPYAAITDENGNFEIPNLPAGKHKFIVWHEAHLADNARGYVTRNLTVTIKADETTEEQISYPVDKIQL